MAISANQIHLMGNYRREEALAYTGSSGILPGHLLRMVPGGQVDVHNVAGGFAERIVAEIDALQGWVNNGVEAGVGYTGNLYTSGTLVQYNVEDSGAEAMMVIKANSTIAAGDALVSNGDGTLVKEAAAPSFGSTKQIIAWAMDPLVSVAVVTLLRVRLA